MNATSQRGLRLQHALGYKLTRAVEPAQKAEVRQLTPVEEVPILLVAGTQRAQGAPLARAERDRRNDGHAFCRCLVIHVALTSSYFVRIVSISSSNASANSLMPSRCNCAVTSSIEMPARSIATRSCCAWSGSLSMVRSTIP